MNINNPILKYVLAYDSDLRYRVNKEKRVDLCSFFFSLFSTVIMHLAIGAMVFGLILAPIGYAIGEFAAAIVTGYWSWQTIYGIIGIVIISSIGVVGVVFGVAAILMMKEYKGTNPVLLFIKSIFNRTCIQIDVTGIK